MKQHAEIAGNEFNAPSMTNLPPPMSPLSPPALRLLSDIVKSVRVQVTEATSAATAASLQEIRIWLNVQLQPSAE